MAHFKFAVVWERLDADFSLVRTEVFSYYYWEHEAQEVAAYLREKGYESFVTEV